mmetsp:Transcript_3026/g.6626  ORF Transcript_3026/g.6626 Transcript_3026/m.6626 type:complete len:694 (-) Transcript_3026:35-2116(-)
MTVMSLELEVLQLSCMFNADPVSTYLRAIFPVFLAAAVILVALRIKKRKHREINVFLQFCNAMGSILNILLISILLMTFRPFLCYKHPGTAGASLRNYPSVVCDLAHGDFLAMVVAGILTFVLIPLPFLALAVYSTCKYPQKMSQYGGENFLKATGFLFFRFTPSRYYYGLVSMTRSLLVCLVPVVIIDDGGFQVLCLTAILILFSQVQMYLHPWRSHKTNMMDGAQSVILVLLLVGSGLTTQLDLDKRAVATLGVVGFALMLFLVLLTMMNTVHRILQVHPFYPYFICHHKADAAAQARYLQLLFVQRTRQTCFIDSDHLTNLEELFDVVRCRCGELCVYLTADTLRRPWCAGEITIAWQVHGKVTSIFHPSFTQPEDDSLEVRSIHNYIASADFKLVEYGITDEAVVNAYRWLLNGNKANYYVDHDIIGRKRLEDVVDKVTSSGNSRRTRFGSLLNATPYNAGFKSSTSSNADVCRQGTVVFSSRRNDDEASATVGILLGQIQASLLEVVPAGYTVLSDLGNEAADEAVAMLASAHVVVVVLTNDSLKTTQQLQVICNAMSEEVPCIPVSTPSFRFPNSQSFQDLKIRYKGEASELEARVQLFFKIISVPFTTYASQQVLSVQATSVLARIPKTSKYNSAGRHTASQEKAIALVKVQTIDEFFHEPVPRPDPNQIYKFTEMQALACAEIVC